MIYERFAVLCRLLDINLQTIWPQKNCQCINIDYQLETHASFERPFGY